MNLLGGGQTSSLTVGSRVPYSVDSLGGDQSCSSRSAGGCVSHSIDSLGGGMPLPQLVVVCHRVCLYHIWILIALRLAI